MTMSKPKEIREINGATPSITTPKVRMSFGSGEIPYEIAAQVDSPAQINGGTVTFGLDENSEVIRPHEIQLRLSEKEIQAINEIAAQEGKSPQEVARNLLLNFLKSQS